ncbi:MAG: metallophosphoesterase family protein [SAR202 cluster bacterium]|nr:metallophosphoesterase family protein [SAR202 cluster bacterium]
MIIGLLSDTHLPNLIRHLDELGPEPAEFFKSVDLILHGGDLTSPTILDWLEQFAPAVCSTGNNDPIPDHRSEEVQTLEIEGWRIGMIHSMEGQFRSMSDLQRLFPTTVDIMIAGHTHLERLEYRDNVAMINSGSITFPRHKELRLGTVGLLELAPGSLRTEIIPLGQSPGRPNPGEAMSMEIQLNGAQPKVRMNVPGFDEDGVLIRADDPV